ncbi:MAG: HAMP domain-containing histidine kinase [Anaerolineae bacterium]|nr:HAMP domain-containing histidine kinase [Anaerolineae bacterium]
MRSLRSRLILSILLPVFIVVPVLILGMSYLLQTQVIVANLANEMTRQAALVADISSSSVEIWQDPGEAQAFVARISRRLSAKLMLLDPEGHLLVSSDPADARYVGTVYAMPDLQSLLSKEMPAQITYNQSRIADVTVPVITSSGKVIGFVRLANPLASIYAQSEWLSQVALYVVIGGILAGLLVGWLLARDIERPLKRTSSAVYDLASGQQPLEVLDEEGPEEVRRLIHAFNRLVERLNSSEESRRRLLANMVHELGRPLGAMLSALQALRSGADQQIELRHELLEGMEGEVVLLQRLLDDLTHLDQGFGQMELQRQSINLADWLHTSLQTWSKAAAEKKQLWSLDIADDLPPVRMDPERLAQALGNLVGNAIHYTPRGGQVCVRSRREDGFVVIAVEDNGPGISLEEQEQIFQPFFRGKSARRFSDGMGLGLPIARDLVEAHGGRLTLESTPGKGSCFSIFLPV